MSEEEFRHWQEISELDEKAATDLFMLGNYPLSVFHYTASRYPGVTSLKDLYTKAKAEQALQWMQTCLRYLKALNLT